jgi:hypothetical protein
MAMSSRRAAAARLREAVLAYSRRWKGGLDGRACNFLARLAESTDAARAFERLKLKDRQEEFNFLLACIRVERLFRTYPQLVAQTERALVQVEHLEQDLISLRMFVDELLLAAQKESSPFDVLSRIYDPPADLAVMEQGLDLIACRIKQGRSVANDDIRRLGTTRKKHGRKAAENAAIWWLAEAVGSFTGKVHKAQVAELAAVILQKTEVSVDRVRHAVGKRHRPLSAKIKRIRTPKIG